MCGSTPAELGAPLDAQGATTSNPSTSLWRPPLIRVGLNASSGSAVGGVLSALQQAAAWAGVADAAGAAESTLMPAVIGVYNTEPQLFTRGATQGLVPVISRPVLVTGPVNPPDGAFTGVCMYAFVFLEEGVHAGELSPCDRDGTH